MRTVFLLAAGVFLCFGGGPALAGPSCADWNTMGFFQVARAADVSRCLETQKVDARDKKYGGTPLHWAAGYSKTPAVVKTLLNAGAELNARGKGGWTPLHSAAGFSKTPAVVKALLNAGAKLNAQAEGGWTPLHSAARYSTTPAIVKMLLDAGANLNTQATGGWTPLHSAAGFSKTPAVVKVLLNAGADPAAKDSADKIPWAYAKENDALKGTDVYWQLNERRFK